jgi:hypothetical protein
MELVEYSKGSYGWELTMQPFRDCGGACFGALVIEAAGSKPLA